MPTSRCLKQDNVFVDSLGNVRIGDFGLSRMLSDESLWVTSATQAPGTVRWMAFELFGLDDDHVEHTKASDMWAYGMIIYVSIFHLMESLCSLKMIGSS